MHKTLNTIPQILLILSTFVLIAVSHITFKMAFNSNWEPGYLGLVRNIFLFFTLFIFLRFHKLSLLSKTKKQNQILILNSFFKTSSLLFSLIALTTTPLYISAMLMATTPVIEIIGIKYFYKKELIKWNEVLGISVTALALVYMSVISFENQIENTWLLLHPGTYLVLLANVLRVAMTVSDKIAIQNSISAKQLVACSSLLSIPIFLVYALTFESNFEVAKVLNTKDMLLLLNLVSVCGIFLFLYRRWILNFIDLKNQAKIRALEPTLIVLFSVVFLGEEISPDALYAFLIILIGISIASLKSNKDFLKNKIIRPY